MHERKFVVKCEGDSLTWNQYIAKLNKRKIWSNMAFCIPTVWESGGTRPCLSHLIAPKIQCKQTFYLSAYIWTQLFRKKAPEKCTFNGWCFENEH